MSGFHPSRRWLATLLATLLPTLVHALSVVDDLGRTVALDRPATRIVTLAPHATELVIAAGLADRLVAIAAGGTVPAAMAAVPRIGGPGALDREYLLSLQPDLVIGWASGNRASDLDWIARSDWALFLSEPRNLQQIARSIRAIGQLGERSAVADASAAAFIDATRTPCSTLPARAAYIVIWDRPAMSVGGQHWINDVLRAAGYRNTFADRAIGVFHIADEPLYLQRGGARIDLARTFDGSPDDRLAEQLSLPGPRLAEAIQTLCQRRRSQAGR